jgi:TDG/mug DNA glycosylase family protein
MKRTRPTRADLLAAAGKKLRDLIAPDLSVLFCGINPGLYSAAISHHFGRPGNRFWPALHASGFTPRLFDPSEEEEMLPLGYGITNVVERATASAAELEREEFVEGGQRLRDKVEKYRPRYLAILGVGAYRTAFAKPQAIVGMQEERLGETIVWVLPSPSGLNAFYNKTLVKHFSELHAACAPSEK